MAKNNKNQKLKKQIKDTLMLTIIICASIYAIYAVISLMFSPTDTFILQEGKISLEDSKVGYIIREEYIIDGAEEVKDIEPIKTEGEKTSVNKPIFKYYNVNQEEIKKQIDDLNNKIQESLLRTNKFVL